MEEEQFLLDGHWYPWGIPIVGCQPSYSLYLDREAASLQLRQCEVSGELITESVVLRHSTCADTQAVAVEVITERAFRTYQLQLAPERLACWQADHQWLELSFEIEL